MSLQSIETLVCDKCGDRVMITEGGKEGHPKNTHLSNGWVEINHRAQTDELAITSTHLCPDHARSVWDVVLTNNKRNQ